MSKKILAVDDSASIRQMVSFTLQQAGYTVVTAVDGVDGVNKAESEAPNMIITDLNMPNMNGIEMIREIRKKPSGKFMPILMLTTESDDSKKAEGKQAGATGWIVKPFNPEQLLKVTQRVMPS